MTAPRHHPSKLRKQRHPHHPPTSRRSSRPHRRRWLIALAITAILVASVILLTVHGPGGTSAGGKIAQGVAAIVGQAKSAVENWCGQQLLAIANERLKPDLAFDSLQYHAPATVVLTNVRVTSEGVNIIEAPTVRIEFTERPKVGEPLVIQTVELTDPRFRLVRKDDGTILGFGDLIEKTPAPSGQPPRKLSDVFAIRHINLINAALFYETPGQPAMILDRMTFDLAAEPQMRQGDEAGWYSMNAKFGRDPIFNWKLDSRINIDRGVMELTKSTWDVQLGQEQYALLPPQLQTFVREHEISGRLKLQVNGLWDVNNVAASDLHMQANLDDGRMALGDYTIPVKSLAFNANLASGTLDVKPFAISGLGGELMLEGRMKMSAPYPMSMAIQASNLEIEQAIRPKPGEASAYAGSVELQGSFTAALDDMRTTTNGNARLGVSNGRLVHVPLIAGINRVVGGSLDSDPQDDHGTADVLLSGDHVAFRNIDLVSNAVAARGEGEIMYDSSISFRFNAGPLERVEGALGKVGEWLGKVTDKIVQYHASGTLSDPVVEAKPLGISVGGGNGNGEK